MERRSFALAALLAAAMLAGGPTLAFAQGQRSAPQGLGDLLKLRPDARVQAPPAGRYVAENVTFTFDRENNAVRFEGAQEVIVLRQQRAPQGGAIYLNDVGEAVLKISGHGGMTLFTPERPQGVPVALIGAATPIRMEVLLRPGLNMGAWVQSMSREISRAVGPQSRIGIEAPLPLDQAAYPLLADVLVLTQQAVLRNARRERTRAKLQDLSTIYVKVGGAPAARVEGGVLEITINPNQGLAGRPSSEKIARALAR
jgi:hypothetical protein